MLRRQHKVMWVAALAGAAVIAIAIGSAFRPHGHSAEGAARSRAQTLACNLSQHGLNVGPCARLVEFDRLATNTWQVRIQGIRGCFLVAADSTTPTTACRNG